MKNKKAGVSFKVAMILFLALSVNKIHIVFAEEGKIDTTKVERFINEASNLIRLSYDSMTLRFDMTKQDDFPKLIKTLDLNDEEYFEVERIISEQVDIRYFIGGLGPLNEEHTYEDFVKCSVFEIAFNYSLDSWEKTFTKEEIIMDKIMPIIKRGNEGLKVIWIIKLDDFSFPDKIRSQIMDEMIRMFSDKSNPEDVRFQAAKLWSGWERRGEKKYEGFDILLKDGDVFEKVGYSLWSLTDIDNPIRNIYEKMFDILENRGKYSNKVVNGILDFFGRDSGRFLGDEGGQRRNRLKKALGEIISEKGVEQIIEESSEILFYIEQKEKEGAYK